jgi:alkylation response protein AidB-like acyl-CoA dehydrogenase
MNEFQDYLAKVESLGFTPEQNAVLQLYRDAGREVVGPNGRQVDQDRVFPRASVDALRGRGLPGLCIPKAYGGLGAGSQGDQLLLMAATMELASWCSSTSQVMSAHNACMQLVAAVGTEAQKQFFFGEALQGHLFATFGAEANANRFMIGSKIAPSGKGFALTGRKHFATSSTGAKWALWVAVNDAGELLLPIIELAAPGVTVTDNWAGIGQRGTGSGVAAAENVAVPAAHVLDALHPNFRDGSTTMGNLQFAAQFTGMAIGAYRSGLAYVRDKSRPWKGLEHASEDPFIRLRVADMSVKIQAARAMVLQAAQVLKTYEDDPSMDELVAVGVSQAKVMATEVALEVTSQVFQVMGASSATTTHGFDRFFRNARTLTLHDPVDRRREMIGMHELGFAGPDVLIIKASGHAGAAPAGAAPAAG